MDRERERQICEVWNKMRKSAVKAKERYIDDCETAGNYYAGPNHDFIYENAKDPDFKVTINKVYELVSIFSPLIFAQNPQRAVEPRTFGRPEVAEAARLYLNYTPDQFGLKAHSKASIDEALIHGRGAMMTGIDAETGFIVSKDVPTKDLLFDPSEGKWYNGYYMMRLRRNQPLWKVARTFGEKVAKRLMEENVLEGEGENLFLDADFEAMDPEDRDLVRDYHGPRVTYVEVFSKMGTGLRARKSDGDTKDWRFGGDSRDHLAIVYQPTKNVIMYMDDWPIPFWADEKKKCSWPVSCYDPAEAQDKVWPISLITPALGEQMFLDWGWSFALGHVKVGSRQIMVSAADLDDKVVIALKGNDSSILIPIDEPNPEVRKNLISAIDMPQLSPALVNILDRVEQLFEKRTGLYEVLYGQSSRQFRSATEAQVKAEFSRLRIDDAIDRCEDYQADVARKEAIGARWKLSGEELAPIVGPELAQAWDLYRPGDLKQMMREYDYTIRAGSMRKRTPQYRAEFAGMRLERLGPIYLSVGDLDSYNATLREWLVANGEPNPEKFFVKVQPPPEAYMQNPQQGQQQQNAPVAAPEVMAVEGGEPVIGSPEQ
jgi:hypothetical protein